MKVKKLLRLLFASILLISQSVMVYAENPNYTKLLIENNGFISPQWTNISGINLMIDFENGEANCYGRIRALSGTTDIFATFKLERQTSSGLVSVKSWSINSSNNSLTFFETYGVVPGCTYRLSVTADVIRNGCVETVNTSVEGYY